MEVPVPEVSTFTILLIESDRRVRDDLSKILAAMGWPSRHFSGVACFLDFWTVRESGVILLNSQQGELWTVGVLQLFQELQIDLPVILHNGDNDVPQAVRLIRGGASDFLTKSAVPAQLIASIAKELDEETRRRARRIRRVSANDKLAELSNRELEVLELLLQGDRNKAAAAKMGIARKTVERHRAAIFQTLGVKSLAAAAIIYDAAKGQLAPAPPLLPFVSRSPFRRRA